MACARSTASSGGATHAVHARVDLQMHRPHRRTWRPQHDAERFLDAIARVYTAGSRLASSAADIASSGGSESTMMRAVMPASRSCDAFLDESDGEHRRRPPRARQRDASSAPWP